MIKVNSLQPINGNVLVEVFEEATTTDSGLALVAAAKMPYSRGTIIAIGPGDLYDGVRETPSVKVGDKVILDCQIKDDELIIVGGKHCAMLSTYSIFGVYE